VSAAAAQLFDEAFPCGPIGRDQHGHVVVLETPGASSQLLNSLLKGMEFDDFLRCQIFNKEVLRRYVASVSMEKEKRMYKVVNVVDLSGFGMAHTKGLMIQWFKQYAGVFGLNYPETMYRTYVINAPMLFTGVWKIVKHLIHPVTAAKISVSSWGHEAVFQKDGISISCVMPSAAKSKGSSDSSESFQTWRSTWATLKSKASSLDELAAGCFAPGADVAALAGLQIHV